MDNKSKSPLNQWAIKASVAWVCIVVPIMVCLGIFSSEGFGPNALGDSLAGICAPLAYLWLVVGTWIQRHELELQREELRLQREATATMATAQTTSTSIQDRQLNLLLAQNEESELAKRSKQKSAINMAIFILLRQLDIVKGLQAKFEGFSDDIEKALILPAFSVLNYEDLLLNRSELGFLLESDNPQILLELFTIQDRFNICLTTVRYRSDFYLTEVLPAMERTKANQKELTADELELMLGERIFQTNINMTTHSHDLLIAFEGDCSRVYNSLLFLAKKIFPGERFVHGE